MIHFIFNPHAGQQKSAQKSKILQLLRDVPNSLVWITTQPLEATQMAQKAIAQKAEKVVAVGGDGTINEVASALLETTIPLGIIPLGSGNGLARHLGIPLQPKEALQVALTGKEIAIDVGLINNRPFFCTMGIGFDAKVATLFSTSTKRGFMNYVKATLKTLFQYRSISISINKGPFEKIFSITIANANQFGNNAYISPHSDIQDAQLEVVKIKPLNIFHAGIIAVQLFLKKIHTSPKVAITSIKSIQIQYQSNQPLHIDGEALLTTQDHLDITIDPLSLLIVAPY